MAARAAAAGPARALPRLAPRPRVPARRLAIRVPVASGVVWIALLALLLSGIVALNVAVVGLNVRLDEQRRERARLQAETAALAAQLSSAAAAERIERYARTRLGFVAAEPDQTRYVDLAAPR